MSTTHVVLRHAACWLGLMGLAIFNGIVRDLLYADALGQWLADQVSAIPLAGLFFVYAWLLHKKWPIPNFSAAVLIGVIWTAMTVGFEWAMATLVMQESPDAALKQYNLLAGNVWILLLLAVLLIPSLVLAIARAKRYAVSQN